MAPLRAHAFVLGACVALLGAAPAPAPPAATAAHFPAAAATALDGARLLTEADAGAQLTGVQIFVTAGLDRQNPRSAGVAALVAECLMRTAVAGTPLREAVAANGGSLQYSLDGRSTHFYLEGMAGKMPSLLDLVTRAFAAPDFSVSAVAATRTDLLARAGRADDSALNLAIAMFRQAYYASAAGSPTLGSRASLQNLSSAEASAFFKTNYRRRGLTLTAVGAIWPDFANAARTFAAAFVDGTPSPENVQTRTIPEEAPRVVARRDVSAPVVVVGFRAPDPGSADFGAMLIVQSLLSGAFERAGATSPALRDRSTGALYLYDDAPSSIVYYINGARVDPALALRGLLAIAQALAKRPLAADALARYKAAAEGQFASDTVTLSDRAYALGTFAAAGGTADPLNRALDALQRAGPADVQRVAKRYLQRYIVTLVLPRQATPES